jgi:hypothetical protein
VVASWSHWHDGWLQNHGCAWETPAFFVQIHIAHAPASWHRQSSSIKPGQVTAQTQLSTTGTNTNEANKILYMAAYSFLFSAVCVEQV